MGNSIINGGKGPGNEARVDSTDKLHIRGVTQDEVLDAVGEGEAFTISSGLITLTSDTVSHLLYIKNNTNRDLVLRRFTFDLGTSDGTGDWQVGSVLNPTGGTIISAGTASAGFNNRVS